MEKRDVKPFIDVEMKDIIYKFNFITGYSVTSICEDLCKQAIKTGVGKELSAYFRREIKLDDVVYPGLKKPMKFERKATNVERISLKLSSNIYEYAYSLSFAIGCSIAKVVAYFLERSMNDFEFLNQYTTEFLTERMNDERKDFMKKVICEVNNDYLSDDPEEYSIASLLLFIVDEYKKPDESIDKVLIDFVT